MSNNMDQSKFDLQLFAEAGASGDAGAAGGENSGASTGDDGKGDDKGANAKKTYTADELETLVNGRLKSAQDKWQADAKKSAEAEKKKAERLAKLSEDERHAAEIQAKEKELAEKEETIRLKELKYDMASELSKRDLPGQFIDYLLGKDSAETLENIKTFEKEFKKAVETGVNNRLKGKAPKGGAAAIGGASGSTASFMDAIRKNQAKR